MDTVKLYNKLVTIHKAIKLHGLLNYNLKDYKNYVKIILYVDLRSSQRMILPNFIKIKQKLIN